MHEMKKQYSRYFFEFSHIEKFIFKKIHERHINFSTLI